MSGREKWHRHPKAVVRFEEPAPEPAAPPEPPAPSELEGVSFQFWEAKNSMYIATGL